MVTTTPLITPTGASTPAPLGSAGTASSVEGSRLAAEELRAWRGFADASVLLIAYLDRELKRVHGITHNDYGVLFELRDAERNELRMSVLADRSCFSKSRLSHQVAKLEKAGLVERRQCPSDSRGVWVALTPKGKAIIEGATPDHRHDVRENFLRQMTPGQITAMGEAFEAILDHLRSVPGCEDGAD